MAAKKEKMRVTDKPLSSDLLRKMTVYRRASNY
jgi:hypothetical protein